MSLWNLNGIVGNELYGRTFCYISGRAYLSVVQHCIHTSILSSLTQKNKENRRHFKCKLNSVLSQLPPPYSTSLFSPALFSPLLSPALFSPLLPLLLALLNITYLPSQIPAMKWKSTPCSSRQSKNLFLEVRCSVLTLL